jgi:two-component system cell cycle sensor histidine kinase/response regulator CckA
LNTTPDPEELRRAAALRRRAEEEFKSLPERLDDMSPAEMQKALHELRVHQIELEMQNDELQKTQASLEEARSQYFELYDQAPVGYFTIGGDGKILRVNSTMAKLLGSTTQALFNQAFTQFVVSEDQDVLYRHRKRLLETGAPQEFELRLKRPEADSPSVLIHAALAHSAEGAPVIRAAALDITERALLEAQLRQAQKMEAVGQLAGGVAHDFNNMLHIILGYTSLLRDTLLPVGEHVEMLKIVEETATRAATLTQQLLAYGQRQMIVPKPINLNDLIEDTVRMYERIFGDLIKFRFRPAFALGTVVADKVQIEQVLMNLCLNARDAMPDGGEITITAANMELDADFCREHAGATEGDYVLVSVADTGVGMSRELQQKIFEPFFTTKKFGESSGLGLAMAHGIVTQHNGMLVVESEPGKGSVFKIYLPRSEAMASLSVGDGPEPPMLGGRETILVAGDEEPVRRMMQRMLEAVRYTVIMAKDSDEAVRTFREHAKTIQLVVLDLAKPGSIGRDVMEAVRAESPQMRLIFCGGYSEDDKDGGEIVKKGLRFLSKPYSRSEFLRVVRESLDEIRSS